MSDPPVVSRFAKGSSPPARTMIPLALAGLGLACFLVVESLDQLPFWCAVWVHQQRVLWRAVGFVICLAATTTRHANRLGLIRACTLSASLVAALLVLGIIWYQLKPAIDSSLALTHHRTYGPTGKPSGRGFLWHLPDYHVRVRFDEVGSRFTGDTPVGSDEIWFFGCSFTFGWGVADRETYSGALAGHHWPEYRLRNYGLPGKGLAEGWLLLEDRLASQPPPRAVIYGWISDQLPRNFRRRSWHQRSSSHEFLLVEIEGQAPVSRGLVPKSHATLPDDEPTTVAELKLATAIVRRMQQVCRTRRVPFYFVALRHRNDGLDTDPLVERLRATCSPEDLPSLIDAREVRGPFFEHDSHPRPEWHRQVADLLAREIRPAVGRP